MKGTKLIIYLISVVAYTVSLSIIFKRPVSFSVSPDFSLAGLELELFGLAMFVCLTLLFLRKHSIYDALSFFVPIIFIWIIIEGDWIIRGIYTFHKLNFYFWDTPVAVIFYYSLIYPLFLLYQKLGKGWINRLKGISVHLLIDVLITTPLAILFGFWTFRSTVFSVYPYIVPVVHLAEVFLGLFYVLFEEWLLAEKRIDEAWKPLVSLTAVFLFLAVYGTCDVLIKF